MNKRFIMGLPEEEWNQLSNAERIAYLDRMLRLLNAAEPDKPISSSPQESGSSRNHSDAADDD